MPRILRDIVQGVLAADPAVALETTAPSDTLSDALARLEPDVAIVADASATPEEYATLLYRHPQLRLVDIASDGRQAHLYELRPHRVGLGALSPETLLGVVRATGATTQVVVREGVD